MTAATTTETRHATTNGIAEGGVRVARREHERVVVRLERWLEIAARRDDEPDRREVEQHETRESPHRAGRQRPGREDEEQQEDAAHQGSPARRRRLRRPPRPREALPRASTRSASSAYARSTPSRRIPMPARPSAQPTRLSGRFHVTTRPTPTKETMMDVWPEGVAGTREVRVEAQDDDETDEAGKQDDRDRSRDPGERSRRRPAERSSPAPEPQRHVRRLDRLLHDEREVACSASPARPARAVARRSPRACAARRSGAGRSGGRRSAARASAPGRNSAATTSVEAAIARFDPPANDENSACPREHEPHVRCAEHERERRVDERLRDDAIDVEEPVPEDRDADRDRQQRRSRRPRSGSRCR